MHKRFLFCAIGLASALALSCPSCTSRDRPRRGEGPGRKMPEKSSSLRIEGMVAGRDGKTFSIAGISGKTTVDLADSTRVFKRSPASVADISAGKWLRAELAKSSSSTSMKATALSLSDDQELIAGGPGTSGSAPPSDGRGAQAGGDREGPPSGPDGGQGAGGPPGDGPDRSSGGQGKVVIGKVESVSGRTITLSTQGPSGEERLTVIVGDGAVVVELVSATADEIADRARVTVTAEKSRDGKLEARSVEIE
jgi:hypothetical protein